MKCTYFVFESFNVNIAWTDFLFLGKNFSALVDLRSPNSRRGTDSVTVYKNDYLRCLGIVARR
jgi:hypothetical protein